MAQQPHHARKGAGTARGQQWRPGRRVVPCSRHVAWQRVGGV
jgi:hypothetical protein